MKIFFLLFVPPLENFEKKSEGSSVKLIKTKFVKRILINFYKIFVHIFCIFEVGKAADLYDTKKLKKHILTHLGF